MSPMNMAMGAITPRESEEDRQRAARGARALAKPGDWLSLALDQHDDLRQAFEDCRQAEEPRSRLAAMKQLALLLNGHSLAEEVVLYPALGWAGAKGHAGLAYNEQSAVKMQMAELERLHMSMPQWADKLEHIRRMVLHHMYEEEGTWFLELRSNYDDQAFLTRRFREEFERYLGGAQKEAAFEARAFAAAEAPPPRRM